MSASKMDFIIAPTRVVPEQVVLHRKDASQRWVYDLRHTDRAVVTTSGPTGHAECGGCGARADQGDKFCRACGCRLVWKGES